jgi:hypothetical protein
LDAAVVKELDGKLVNFVGYEFDLVRALPNGSHVSVPAWELYNHHYGNTIMGKGVTAGKQMYQPLLNHRSMHRFRRGVLGGGTYLLASEAGSGRC